MAADGILIGLSALSGIVLGPLGIVVALIGVLVVQAARGAWSQSRLALAFVAAVIGMLRAMTAEDTVTIEALAESAHAVGVVASLPVAGGSGERVVLSLELVGDRDGVLREASGNVLVYLGNGPPVGRGDRLKVTWSAMPAVHATPGYAAFLSSQDAAGSATVWAYQVLEPGPSWLRALSDARRGIAQELRRALPGDAGALAVGIVTGDDSGLSDRAEGAFRRSGTSHITAVSGQNIGLLLAFCALWLRPARPASRTVARVVMIALVWSYAVMVGLEAPALRAAIVATLTILGAWSGRRPDPLTLLALALGGMAMIEPAMVRGAGFWLSAAASLALCSVMRLDGRPTLTGFVRQSMLSVVAASVATLPTLIWVFGEWSPVSPLANVLIGPLLTVTFPAAYVLAIVLMIEPALAPLMGWIPGIGLDATLAVVQRVGDIVPMLRLDATGPVVALGVGVPCAVLLASLSRDATRWQRILHRRWTTDRDALASLIVGAILGTLLALAVIAAR